MKVFQYEIQKWLYAVENTCAATGWDLLLIDTVADSSRKLYR